ncbi:metal ABC transporter substrate-binding protein [Nocardioides sp. 503]|uniref:metal ABC transporter substrate-binding protein n=1 Tax=Nocardioides sp. 503 TaxID=2508326 RepID=UPI00106F0CE1|nr:metal ABC transporter substrate-binding protein [Nocardioides sp. 503]
MNTPHRRTLRSSALLAAGALALSGCGALSDDTASVDDGIQVVAAFYPLQYVAERVAGDRVDVENLTQPGGEPHDLELTPRETGAIVDADLVVFETGFQPTVDDSVEANATGEVLDVADVVDLQKVEEHEDEHADEGEHEEEGHDHGDVDPHFWQDPLRMADLGDAVAERLGEVDPDHADDYTANAADLRTDLEALDASYESTLQTCERSTVVVSHDAFSYLTKYGLDMEPINGLSPEAEPTPADRARLEDLIREDGITTVFSERLATKRLANAVAEDAGVTTAVLDPIEGLSDETSDDDYLTLMAANLQALVKANGCR